MLTTQHFDQLVANDFHDLLAGTQALHYFLAYGLLLHRVGELLHDFEVHVRLEESHADFLQCFVQVDFGEAAFAAQVLEDAL